MTNEPSVRVVATPHFNRSFKRLRKKYRRIEGDLKPFIAQLERGETPGDQIQRVKLTVYKARIPSTDAQRGKSGGYRVIYYLKMVDFIFLVDIYPKSERADISTGELHHLIEEVEAEFSDE
ncbi:MAG: type II toxin-antitoxin system RelE/ParE family toxin [Anaerolineae bacterium]|nr:type II toxin-antitoxin system RelE/ParE family toxin [Anaerolineae bacterium]